MIVLGIIAVAVVVTMVVKQKKKVVPINKIMCGLDENLAILEANNKK